MYFIHCNRIYRYNKDVVASVLIPKKCCVWFFSQTGFDLVINNLRTQQNQSKNTTFGRQSEARDLLKKGLCIVFWPITGNITPNQSKAQVITPGLRLARFPRFLAPVSSNLDIFLFEFWLATCVCFDWTDAIALVVTKWLRNREREGIYYPRSFHYS